MRSYFVLLLLGMTTIAHAEDYKYLCVNTKTKKEIMLTIIGDGAKIDFYGKQTRRSKTPDVILDGKPAYSYVGANYSGITLPEAIMEGKVDRGQIYETGYDSSARYNCVVKK